MAEKSYLIRKNIGKILHRPRGDEMKVKTYLIEVPAERFIMKIKGFEIIVSDIEDLDLLLEKYKVDDIVPDIPDGGSDGK